MPAAPGGCGPTPPAVAAAGCRAGGRAASPAVPAPHVTMTQGSLAPHAVYSAYEPGSRGFSPPAANRSLSRLTQASQSSRIMLGSLDDGGGHALHAAPLHTVNSSQVSVRRAPRLCCVAALATCGLLPLPSAGPSPATAGAGPRLASQALPPELARLPPLLLVRHLLLRLPDLQPRDVLVPPEALPVAAAPPCPDAAALGH